jgi:hypothetical protein
MLRCARRCLPLLLSLQVGACGYLIFEERAGQPPGGKIDWGIVALDAVGLLFGVIPGIVAFAVDFSTGCIYLPAAQPAPGYGAAQPLPAGVPAGWLPALTVAPFAGDAEVASALARYLDDQGYLPSPVEAVQIRWQAGTAVPVEPPRQLL